MARKLKHLLHRTFPQSLLIALFIAAGCDISVQVLSDQSRIFEFWLANYRRSKVREWSSSGPME